VLAAERVRFFAVLVAPLLVVLGGCPNGGSQLRGNPDFADAARYTFAQFENPEDADLAFAVRRLERELYLTANLEASSTGDRSLVVAALRAEDLEGFEETPDVYPEGFDRAGEEILPGSASPLAVATLSSFEVALHSAYPILEDQRVVEPGSPNHYDRSFVEETELCWGDRSCSVLRTANNLTKQNALLQMTYDLSKDYRWVDLNLPAPASVLEGEPIVNEGPTRWAIVARSWNPRSAVGDAGANAIFQSYSIEIWVPRDGGGFVRDGSEENVEGGEWTTDSSGGGTLRMMAVWAETSFGMNALVEQVTRDGIDDIFDAQEEWLETETDEGN
jgi:hypothetical protein